MSGPTTSDPAVPGPLDRQTAEALLARADVLLAASEFDAARAHYARLIGFPDPAITGAALLGTGEALFRLDDEAGALWSWEQVTRLPENPSAYAAWRQVAAARVRAGSLRAAFDAYREAARRPRGHFVMRGKALTYVEDPPDAAEPQPDPTVVVDAEEPD